MEHDESIREGSFILRKESYLGIAITCFTLSTMLLSTFVIAHEDWHGKFLNINIVCGEGELYHWSSNDKEWSCITDQQQEWFAIKSTGKGNL